MEPRKFGMWIFMGSVFMLFAALTSAYIVREAEGNWVYFDMPQVFTISTVVILVSSITMQWAYWSAKKDNLQNAKVMMIHHCRFRVSVCSIAMAGLGSTGSQ
jgi:cytochrome c oxidase subunit 3